MPPSSRFMPGAVTVSLFLVLLAAASACGATPLDVAERRQLLLDAKFFDSSCGITLTVHPPQNTDTSAAGEACVELLDETGAPIPGFTLADADRIHTANDIDRRVSWRGQVSVASLASQPIRVHMLLRDTDLYAFQFRPSSTR